MTDYSLSSSRDGIDYTATRLTRSLIWLSSASGRKRFVLLGLDLLSVLIAGCFSHLAAIHIFSADAHITDYVPIAFVLGFSLTLSLYLLNGYKPLESRRAETELAIIVKSITFAVLILFAARFILFRQEAFSRYIVPIWCFNLLLVLAFFRFGLSSIYRSFWRNGYLKEKVLLIGDEEETRNIKDHFAIQRHHRFEYVTLVPNMNSHENGNAVGTEYWNSDQFQETIDKYDIDRVIIVPYKFSYKAVTRMSSYYRQRGVSVSIISDEFSIMNQEVSIDEYTGSLVLEADNGRPLNRKLNRFLRRASDTMISLILLPIVGFFYVLIGIATKIQDGGPVIYRRRVMGKGGEEFYAFKFRSMLVNADEILETNPELRKEFVENYKLENDPRLMKTGALIRKTSIDELPQIVNVLLGQMSLIGPRMKVREEVDKYYGELKDKLLSVKPGITGFWQVSGRQKTDYAERVRMDMFYIDHWSIWMDIVIFIKTIWKVIKQEGAH